MLSCKQTIITKKNFPFAKGLLSSLAKRHTLNKNILSLFPIYLRNHWPFTFIIFNFFLFLLKKSSRHIREEGKKSYERRSETQTFFQKTSLMRLLGCVTNFYFQLILQNFVICFFQGPFE